jgi:Chaperone of endosialidase
MSGVPYTFANATTTIALSNLDTNFATPVTIGNTTVALGNTVTTLVGLTNVSTTVVNTSNVASNTSLLLQSNGSTTAVTIDTSQNVSLSGGGYLLTGITSVQNSEAQLSTNLYLSGAYDVSNKRSYQLYVDGNGALNFAKTGSYSYATLPSSGTYSTAMLLDTSGNLIVNNTSAGAGIGWSPKLTVDAGSSYGASFKSGSSGAGYECIDAWNIATSGNNSFVNFYTEASATFRGSITYNRSLGQTAYNITSDRRLKSNIEDLTNSGTIIDSLKPRTYTWNETNQQTYGFIADEFQTVFPHAVQGEPNATEEQEYEITPAVKDEQGNITTPAVMGTRTVPVYQQLNVSSSEIMANIIAELQSLRKRVAALEAKVGV